MRSRVPGAGSGLTAGQVAADRARVHLHRRKERMHALVPHPLSLIYSRMQSAIVGASAALSAFASGAVTASEHGPVIIDAAAAASVYIRRGSGGPLHPAALRLQMSRADLLPTSVALPLGSGTLHPVSISFPSASTSTDQAVAGADFVARTGDALLPGRGSLQWSSASAPSLRGGGVEDTGHIGAIAAEQLRVQESDRAIQRFFSRYHTFSQSERSRVERSRARRMEHEEHEDAASCGVSPERGGMAAALRERSRGRSSSPVRPMVPPVVAPTAPPLNSERSLRRSSTSPAPTLRQGRRSTRKHLGASSSSMVSLLADVPSVSPSASTSMSAGAAELDKLLRAELSFVASNPALTQINAAGADLGMGMGAAAGGAGSSTSEGFSAAARKSSSSSFGAHQGKHGSGHSNDARKAATLGLGLGIGWGLDEAKHSASFHPPPQLPSRDRHPHMLPSWRSHAALPESSPSSGPTPASARTMAPVASAPVLPAASGLPQQPRQVLGGGFSGGGGVASQTAAVMHQQLLQREEEAKHAYLTPAAALQQQQQQYSLAVSASATGVSLPHSRVPSRRALVNESAADDASQLQLSIGNVSRAATMPPSALPSGRQSSVAFVSAHAAKPMVSTSAPQQAAQHPGSGWVGHARMRDAIAQVVRETAAAAPGGQLRRGTTHTHAQSARGFATAGLAQQQLAASAPRAQGGSATARLPASRRRGAAFQAAGAATANQSLASTTPSLGLIAFGV